MITLALIDDWSEEEVEAHLVQEERELCALHLLDFVQGAWHVLEPTNKYVHGWHIEAICEHLEAVTRLEIRNLLINIPPRCAKSLLVAVFWPAWVWIKQPSKRWLYNSYAQDLSTRDSVKCRTLIQSPWYQARWGTALSWPGIRISRRDSPMIRRGIGWRPRSAE